MGVGKALIAWPVFGFPSLATYFSLHIIFVLRADTSDRGMGQSFGIMVNYRYEMDQVHTRNQDYVLNHIIATSSEVKEMLQ